MIVLERAKTIKLWGKTVKLLNCLLSGNLVARVAARAKDKN